MGGDDETEIAGNKSTTTGQNLTEQISQIRKRVGAIKQEIITPAVWVGSDIVNLAQLMLNTLDVVKLLAEQTASHSHSHSNTGTPPNADAIREAGAQADNLTGKYSPFIA